MMPNCTIDDNNAIYLLKLQYSTEGGQLRNTMRTHVYTCTTYKIPGIYGYKRNRYGYWTTLKHHTNDHKSHGYIKGCYGVVKETTTGT